MEEPLEILVVEPKKVNRLAAQKACPEGVILIFAGNFEEAMEEAEKTYSTYDRAIFELYLPKEGIVAGWGHIPMCGAMEKRIPSLLFTEKKEWGKARAYTDPLFYRFTPDRYQLETPRKFDADAWKQVFDYLLNNRQALEEN